MNTLSCALIETVFNSVPICQSAQEISQLLDVTHEGTSQIKESKISLFTHKYEVFKMKEEETNNAMYNYLNDIIIGLKELDKVIRKAELNCKLLLSLPKGHPKVKAIEEAKGLAIMTMEEIFGSLITHEHTLQMDREVVEINKKKKELTLRILIQEEDEDLDEEMVLLTRKFNTIFKKKIGANTSRRQKEEGKKMKKSKEKKENTKDKSYASSAKGLGM